MICHSILHVIL